MRFLLDGMLGKLTRWIRILGYDAVYSRKSSDNDLLRRAKQESFILLTSDAQLYRTAISRGIECFLIDGRTDSERLADIANRFNLKLKIDPKTSRCPICGFPIKLVAKEEIVDSIPPATFKVYQDFWVCTNSSCAKIYWQGSHWKKIEERLKEAGEIFERRRRQRTETRAVHLP